MPDILIDVLAKPQWIFDLDNTLYDADASIFKQMDVRMRNYILEHTDISPQDEYVLRKKYLHDYGNSLVGLEKYHGVDKQHFVDYIHDLDYADIGVCPIIVNGIKNTPVQKFIHTNGSHMHGIRVCKKMGIESHIDGFFGIEDSLFIPKPNSEAFTMMWEKYAIDPKNIVFFEDTVCNLEYPKRCGATTVYINRYHMIHTDIPDYVDVVVQDLSKVFE